MNELTRLRDLGEALDRGLRGPSPQLRQTVLTGIGQPRARALRGHRWAGWMTPLAAAAAVTAVVAGTAAVSSAIHGPGAIGGASLGHGVTAYVTNPGSGTVTPIRTGTNTALPTVKTGHGSDAIAITPDGKAAYVINLGLPPRFQGTVTPIRTATNTALPPIKVGDYPQAIAITPD